MRFYLEKLVELIKKDSKVSMSHVKVLPCFMFFYVLIFVAVELFWHIGDMERRVFATNRIS